MLSTSQLSYGNWDRIHLGKLLDRTPHFTLFCHGAVCRALYALLFLQFSANTFYDPARRAITPTIVSKQLLPLATTLDSFAWSLVGAFGASIGGFAVRRTLSLFLGLLIR